MKKIIYTRPDGGLSIVTPIINTYPTPENITEAQAIQRALAKIPPGSLNVKVIEENQIPSDRTYRNAWVQNATGVQVDMALAKDLHMRKIRAARDKELLRLDSEWSKFTGQKKNKEADDTEKLRQTLRDIPQTFDLSSAQTPEALSALWPTEIPK